VYRRNKNMLVIPLQLIIQAQFVLMLLSM